MKRNNYIADRVAVMNYCMSGAQAAFKFVQEIKYIPWGMWISHVCLLFNNYILGENVFCVALLVPQVCDISPKHKARISYTLFVLLSFLTFSQLCQHQCLKISLNLFLNIILQIRLIGLFVGRRGIFQAFLEWQTNTISLTFTQCMSWC